MQINKAKVYYSDMNSSTFPKSSIKENALPHPRRLPWNVLKQIPAKIIGLAATVSSLTSQVLELNNKLTNNVVNLEVGLVAI